MFRVISLCTVAAVVLAPGALAADAPTFEVLDRELNFYKVQAGLQGDSNAQLEFEGLAYYAIFDLVLEVLNDPEHPKHEATKAAWDANHAYIKEVSPMVSSMLGNLVPLLITSSSEYAEGFEESAKQYAPNFEAAKTVQPLATTTEDGKYAWFHGAADADCDGVNNRDELAAVAEGWRAETDADGNVKAGTGRPVTEEERKKFVEEALSGKNDCLK